MHYNALSQNGKTPQFFAFYSPSGDFARKNFATNHTNRNANDFAGKNTAQAYCFAAALARVALVKVKATSCSDSAGTILEINFSA